MSISIRRPSIHVPSRPLAARLVACGAVLAVAASAACQSPTEPRVHVAPSAARPLTQEALATDRASHTDTATVDTVITSPHERGFWW